MKLPVINDIEIVPVRLIPIITHGEFGHGNLSGILANRIRVDGFPVDRDYGTLDIEIDGEIIEATREQLGLCSRSLKNINVFAYHLDDDGVPVKMLAIEWDNIYRDISVLEPRLRNEEKKSGLHDDLFSEWRQQATKHLPPGVFLWRRDLDMLWKFRNLFYCKTEGEPTDFRTLNYGAYIRHEERSIYFKGFEALLSVEYLPVPPLTQPAVTVNIDLQQNLLFMHAVKDNNYDNQPAILIVNEKESAVSDVQPQLSAAQPIDDVKTYNLPDRKGLKVPKEERRKVEDFTCVINSLFNQLVAEGNLEILRPGNPLEFLKCLKRRVQGLDKVEDGIWLR